MQVHITYGVYIGSRSWKRNVVAAEDLECHINYNRAMRFGRMLVVDGKVEHKGYFTEEDAQAWVDNELPKIEEMYTNKTHPTIPYQ